MHFSISILFCLLFSLSSFAQSSWKKAYEKDQLVIYTRTTKTGLFEFKATQVMPQPLKKVHAVIKDHASYPKWSYKTKSLEIIERISPDAHYAHTIVDFPFPMKDRDLVMLSETTYPDSKTVLIQLEGKPKKIAKQEDFVRIETVQGYWRLTKLSDNKTEVIYQMASESVGLPNWLIETFALEAPKQNMTKINERAGKL
ncbi:MAG: START domain-containing protein [Bacteroidota bacterium]